MVGNTFPVTGDELDLLLTPLRDYFHEVDGSRSHEAKVFTDLLILAIKADLDDAKFWSAVTNKIAHLADHALVSSTEIPSDALRILWAIRVRPAPQT